MLTDPTIVPVIETIATDTTPVTTSFARVMSPIGKSILQGPVISLTNIANVACALTISHSISNENNVKGETPIPTDRVLVRIDYNWTDSITDRQLKAFCYVVLGSPRVADYEAVDAAKAFKTLVGLLLTKVQGSGAYALDPEVLTRLAAGEG